MTAMSYYNPLSRNRQDYVSQICWSNAGQRSFPFVSLRASAHALRMTHLLQAVILSAAKDLVRTYGESAVFFSFLHFFLRIDVLT